MEQGAEDKGIVAVTVIQGEVFTKEERAAAKAQKRNPTQDTNVRNNKDAMRATTENGWISLQWQERPKVGVSVTGFNVSEEELRSVVESVELEK